MGFDKQLVALPRPHDEDGRFFAPPDPSWRGVVKRNKYSAMRREVQEVVSCSDGSRRGRADMNRGCGRKLLMN